MTLERRIGALEAHPGADNDERVKWGPGDEHFPKMTKGELKKMLENLRETGVGRLLVRPGAGQDSDKQQSWLFRRSGPWAALS